MMSVTGVVLTYERQAQVWEDRSFYAEPEMGQPMLTSDQLVAASRNLEGFEANSLMLNSDPTALFLLSLHVNGTEIDAEKREVAHFTVFGTSKNSAQQQAIESLLDALKETCATQNVQAHLALFAPDAKWINAYARMFRGTTELEVFLRDRLFPTFSLRVSLRRFAMPTLFRFVI